ncbi:MAG: trigger factor [Actinomycetota bacterium]|nr:trigger factor [Actinomycetota bacterium]
MAVKAEKEVLEGNKVKIKVEVPAEEVDGAIDRAFRDISREVFIPGFRKGKVPKRVLQARLGMDAIYEEVKQSNLPDYYAEALDQLGIKPIDEPDIDIEELEIEEGKPLVFEAEVEIKPQVELEGYIGIEVEKPDEEVADEDIDKALESVRENFAQLEVASGKALDDGDYALIDYTGTVNGEPFGGSNAKDMMLELGTENIWPEFNQELKEKRKGDILDIKVQMPEHIPDEDLAGKIAYFKVIVKEVKVKKLPDADDDFAKESSQFDTLQELKDDIRGKMEEAKKVQAEDSVRMQVLEKLAEGLEVEIPQKMVDDFTQGRKNELEARLASRGISLDSYLEAMDYTEKRMEEELAEEAEKVVRNELVLDAVIRGEGLEVSDEELQEEIERRAGIFGVAPEQYREVTEKREGLENLRDELLHRKTLKFLGDNAVFAGGGGNRVSGVEEEAPSDNEREAESED